MNIAFLGWGSLVWDPRNLRTGGTWRNDGPELPIEFARVSKDGRLTLVICSGARKVKTLWTPADCSTLDEAVRNLACREDTVSENIGFISVPDRRKKGRLKDSVLRIEAWAKEKGLDAVVWTDLKPKFKEICKTELTSENAIAYLRKLDDNSRKKAEMYVRNTPQQINTKIRESLEKELGWTCTDDNARIQRWSDIRERAR
ncbi:MAG: hypothetical protein ABSF24_09675 [Candidatus Bathyarchaeia archaeon]|jgi:hypothetical protein